MVRLGLGSGSGRLGIGMMLSWEIGWCSGGGGVKVLGVNASGIRKTFFVSLARADGGVWEGVGRVLVEENVLTVCMPMMAVFAAWIVRSLVPFFFRSSVLGMRCGTDGWFMKPRRQ